MSRRARALLAGVGVVAAMVVLARAQAPGSAADERATSTPAWLECAECHAEIDAQWRGSLHATAWTDPIVQAEYARSPAPTCRGCHAPADVPERGIDCAACHVRDGWILAARPSPAGVLAHPVRATPAQGTVDACRGCHQFDFADDGVHDPREPLQDTLAEWARSTAADEGRTCQACHMAERRDPDGVRRTSHALRGLDDPQLLAEAVRVDGEALADATGVTVRLELRGHRIGHAFPTGDLFREAVLTLRTDAGARDAIVLKRWLASTIDPDGDDHHVRQVDDTRVPPPGDGTLRDEVRLDDPTATRVHWELRLHRLAPAAARSRGLDAHAQGIAVASGEFPVQRRR
jgi:hypothetical protein